MDIKSKILVVIELVIIALAKIIFVLNVQIE